MKTHSGEPGSKGERDLQGRLGTANRARGFYNHQMLDHLNERMQDFVAHMDMAFIATADANGECDSSFRSGPPGFIGVLNERTLVYPEYRGNGVMASLGNISENGHVGILFVDFFGSKVGLHVNGRARIVENSNLLERPDLPEQVLEGVIQGGGRAPERWVLVHVVEAYIHCSKHIPQLHREGKELAWGTDDTVRKGGDFFKAKHSSRPWVDSPVAAEVPTVAAPRGAIATPQLLFSHS